MVLMSLLTNPNGQVRSGTYVTDDLDKRICEPIVFAGGFREKYIEYREQSLSHRVTKDGGSIAGSG